jgi:PPOX class probable F420-dependent enzyme
VTVPLTDPEATFLDRARVARLASVGPDGWPHVVPVCPALDGDRIVVGLLGGAKLRNVRADPRVALLVDGYVEDWDALAGVLVRGPASFLDGEEWMRARDLLYEKFPQYPDSDPLEGEAIVAVAPERVASWGL